MNDTFLFTINIIRNSTIHSSVAKFIGYHSHLESLNTSGKSNDDILSDAYALYHSENDCDFLFYSCWTILRNCPKFFHETQKKNKKTKSATQNVVNVDDENEDGEQSKDERPMGRKKAKAEQKLELQKNQRMSEPEAERIRILNENAKAMKNLSLIELMSVDLNSNTLSAAAKKWFAMKQEDILKEYEEEAGKKK